MSKLRRCRLAAPLKAIDEPLLWGFLWPLLWLFLMSGSLGAQTGPMPRAPDQRGPGLRLPELELPLLLLELDGKPLRAGTRVLAELVGANATTTVEGRVDERGQLKLGKTRNLGLLSHCELRVTADFLPSPAGAKASDGAGPKPRSWFQYIRTIKISDSQVRCQLKRMEPVLLGVGTLLGLDDKPLAGVEWQAFSYTGDPDYLLVIDEGDEPPPSNDWREQSEMVFALGRNTTDAKGRFVIWSPKREQANRSFSVRFKEKDALAWVQFRAIGNVEQLRFQIARTRRLAFELVLPSDLPMESVDLLLQVRTRFEVHGLPPSRLTKLRQAGAKTHWRVDFCGLPAGKYWLELVTRREQQLIRISKPTTIKAGRIHYPDNTPRIDWSEPLPRIPVQICDSDGVPLQGSWVSLFSHLGGKRFTLYAKPADDQGRASPPVLTGGEALLIWSRDHEFLRIQEPKPKQSIRLRPVKPVHFKIPAGFARPRPKLELELLLSIPRNSGNPLPPPQIRAWWRATPDAQGLVSMKVGWPGPMHIYLILTNTDTKKRWLVPTITSSPYYGLHDRSKAIPLRFDAKTWQTALDKIGIH